MNWSNSWGDKPANAPSPQSNPKPSAFPDWDSKSQDEVLMEWQQRQKLLTLAKEREMEFRKYVVSRAFPKPEEGTNTLDLGNGYALKANVKFSYKLDNDNQKIENMLEALSKIDNNGSFIAERLVNWHPTLSLKEYRELEPKYKQIVDSVVTIFDAAPSLEIVEPKIKK